MVIVIMLSVAFLFIVMLNALMLSVIMLNFILLCVVRLNVVLLNIFMLSVVAPGSNHQINQKMLDRWSFESGIVKQKCFNSTLTDRKGSPYLDHHLVNYCYIFIEFKKYQRRYFVNSEKY
jgi:hypothetical protein